MSTRELFRINAIPVYQNKMFDTRDAAVHCPVGDVVLVQDTNSGLVFNDAFDPVKLCYDETYQNEQGHSCAFQAHMHDVLEIIDRNFRGERILEVGCGKGTFLELVRHHGHDALGVDAAYEGNAPYILKRHFDATLGVVADGIILRHVLEHIPKPIEFLRAIAATNDHRGKIYIEVPCLDWILEHRAWFDIFYEHVNYFRAADFSRIFDAVHESGHLFNGQYHYVVANLDSLRDPETGGIPEPLAFPSDFLNRFDDLVQKTSRANTRVVWGAAAKGVMFSHHLTTRGSRLDFAIDINPAKQGKFLAGIALPILSPEAGLRQLVAGDDIFVMNSNYLPEIQDLGGNHLNYIPADRQ